MSKWWITGQPFTCRNRQFQTDLTKGKPHGTAPARGSVFDVPLVSNGGYTLWLEYVENHKHGGNAFWLMWYDARGVPTIPLSGVADLDQLRSMNSQLASFIQIP